MNEETEAVGSDSMRTLDILSTKMYETDGYATKIGGADFDNTAKLTHELNFK